MINREIFQVESPLLFVVLLTFAENSFKYNRTWLFILE